MGYFFGMAHHVKTVLCTPKAGITFHTASIEDLKKYALIL